MGDRPSIPVHPRHGVPAGGGPYHHKSGTDWGDGPEDGAVDGEPSASVELGPLGRSPLRVAVPGAAGGAFPSPLVLGFAAAEEGEEG